jgi:hypothetical protein
MSTIQLGPCISHKFQVMTEISSWRLKVSLLSHTYMKFWIALKIFHAVYNEGQDSNMSQSKLSQNMLLNQTDSAD